MRIRPSRALILVAAGLLVAALTTDASSVVAPPAALAASSSCTGSIRCTRCRRTSRRLAGVGVHRQRQDELLADRTDAGFRPQPAADRRQRQHGQARRARRAVPTGGRGHAEGLVVRVGHVPAVLFDRAGRSRGPLLPRGADVHLGASRRVSERLPGESRWRTGGFGAQCPRAGGRGERGRRHRRRRRDTVTPADSSGDPSSATLA